MQSFDHDPVDLHCHTSASDGILSPGELVSLALDSGIQVMAVTDHDTVDGVDEAVKEAEGTGLTVIPGIEFSIDINHGSFHLLGYNIDQHHEPLVQQLEVLEQERSTRVTRILEDLEKHGVYLSEEEVRAEAGDGVAGRPHVARVMVSQGYGESVRDIFTHYLTPGKPGYASKEKISHHHAMELIHDSGGRAVLAHPVTLDLVSDTEYEKMLTSLVEDGLDGIEVYSNLHDEYYVELFQSLANRYNLGITGGSDYHGDRGELLGFYGDGRKVPVSVLEAIGYQAG